MKIVSLVGARPQFIKEAVLNRIFKEKGIAEVLVNSGQHYDHNMAGSFFESLNIGKTDYDLRVGSGSHAEVTARTMIEFEKVVLIEKPEMIVLYGDTNTTLAGAVVASKLKIPIAHVEAGVRMNPKTMPEEINRILTDRVSTYLFCTSQICVDNLKGEGIVNEVHLVGDVMYDIFLEFTPQFNTAVLENYNLKEEGFVLLTLHRDYNVDDPVRLKSILTQLARLSEVEDIIFPIHPRTIKKIKEFGFEIYLENIRILEPLDYLDLMGLLVKCKYLITDSGGLQKESYFAGKHALLFMIEAAWPELVNEGINSLINDDLLELTQLFSKNSFKKGIYGDGNAGSKIVDIINRNQE